MNMTLFFLTLGAGFLAFIMANKLWENAGGVVEKKMVFVAALLTVGAAYWLANLV